MRIGETGLWVVDPFHGDAVGIDPSELSLTTGWLFPRGDDEYVHDLAALGDDPWAVVTTERGTDAVIRLDPIDGTVLARIPLGDSVHGPVTVTSDSVWVVVWRDGAPTPHAVVRIDRRTETVAAVIDIPNVSVGFYFNDQIIDAGGSVILSGYACACPDPPEPGTPLGRLVRIDATTNGVTSVVVDGISDPDPETDLGFGPFTDLAYGDGLLWGVRLVGDFDGRDIVRIDPTTLETLGGSIVFDTAPYAVDVAFGQLWVSHPLTGEITVIDLAALP